jgi:chemosensory pili system protein ChpA (sensor histidine kinase/response regulator)
LLRVRAELVDQLVNEAGEMAISRSRIDGSLKSMKGALLDLGENVARLRAQLREFEILAESQMQSQLAGSAVPERDFDPLELDRFTRLQELTRMMAESVNDVATVQHGLLRQADSAGEAVVAQSRQNRELSHALLRARMVPVATVAERLHRVVRQTAKELERQANLDIRGADTPVDRNVLERMLGPLEHLLRNAVAHGIEAPAQRRAAGKPELGQITLSIRASDNDISLELADDGRGLDYAAIRRRASERGLLVAADDISDAELAELIFRAGFSTAQTVNEIAGRGVGLDVVKHEVMQLGGQIIVRPATPDGGTRFEISLPLTLAVIPIMLVQAGGRHWAIPATLVEEARELTAEDSAALHAVGAVIRGNRRYPWQTLPQLFGEAPAPAAGADGGKTWQLLLASGGVQLALEVDTLRQNLEVVVKALGDQLARVPGLTGATVLPDGSVALIVNPVSLFSRVAHIGSAAAPMAAVPPAPTFTAPLIMVVDDSLTVRKITGRLLERAGYRVLTARDGIDALEQLKQATPAVILADIEMPRMDGFELVRTLRNEPRWADLPVIMITSRIAAKHRQLAQELGVADYLGKPYDETALLALIARLVQDQSAG